MTQPRILCVDDEPQVLKGLQMQLEWDYEVEVAESGEDGLNALASGPFAVVISDMRMPKMNGAAFLERVRTAAPDSTRMLLTGYSDIESAIDAVNKGNVFRFLQKPCHSDTLGNAVSAAVKQNRLVLAERELLEQTLNGAVDVVTQILSLTAPLAFSRSDHLKGYIAHIVEALEVHDGWRFELAAMLSQIGCVTVPPTTLDKVYAGQAVTEKEQGMMDAHPGIASELLANIPRLELVAEIVARQDEAWSATTLRPTNDKEFVQLGATLLGVAKSVDASVRRGSPIVEAVERVAARGSETVRAIVATLRDYQPESSTVIQAVGVMDLRASMVLDEDVRSKSGTVVVPAGRIIDRTLVERLRNFANGVGLVEPIRVRIPT